MSALTSLLARDAVVPVEQIESALQRQVLEGGEIDTALLELDAAKENTLNAYRAATYGLPAAARADVMDAPSEVIERVPRELAERLRVVPFAVVGRELRVAAAKPLDAEDVMALEDQTGLQVLCFVAVAARVEAALAVHYGIEITGRMRLLAQRLDEMTAGELPPVAGQGIARASGLGDDFMKSFDSEPPSAEHAIPPAKPSPRRRDDTSKTADEAKVKRPGAVAVAPVVSVTSPREREEVSSISIPVSRGGRSRSRAFFRRVSSVPKGPMAPHLAREMLEKAPDRDSVLDIFFSFARQYFYGAALFAVRDDHAMGLESYGMGGHFDIENVSVKLNERSALAEIVKTRATRVIDLTRREADAPLVSAIARERTQPSALVPVCIRQRLVALLYGDRDGEPFRVEELADLVEMLPYVVRAFERIIRERKMFARRASRRFSAPPPAPAPAVDSLTPARTGKTRSDLPVTPPPDSRHDPEQQGSGTLHPLVSEHPEVLPPADASMRAALHSLGVPRSAPPPPEVEAREVQPTVRLPPAPSQRRDRSQPLSTKAPAPRSVKPPPGTGAYSHTLPAPSREHGSDEDADEDDAPDELTTQPLSPTPRRRSRNGRPRRDALAGLSPDINGDEASPLGGSGDGTPGSYRLEDVSSEVLNDSTSRRQPGPEPSPDGLGQSSRDATTTQPLAPRPRRRPARSLTPDGRREHDGKDVSAEVVRLPPSVRQTLRPPAIEPEPGPEPKVVPAGSERSVIVDMGADVVRLVEDLCRCGPEDEGPIVDHLVRLGDVVLPELVDRFPGPLWFDRHQSYKRLPKGSDVSAICRALSRFGAKASPYLATLVRSDEVETRFYATLLAADRVDPVLMAPLAGRLLDPDPKIRLIAMDVFPAYRNVEGFDDQLAGLRERAADRKAPLEKRMAALDGVAAARDPESIEVLLLLKGEDRQLSIPAHRALVAITGQDFGDSIRKWTNWYRKNRQRHRIEWLIDSLMHSEQRVRSLAGLELQKLTHTYYGYVADASKKDRERAQSRYREWWAQEGAGLFA